jgi:hypothetical protein
MSRQDPHTALHKATYRKFIAGGVLLAVVALVIAGVAVARVRRHAGDIDAGSSVAASAEGVASADPVSVGEDSTMPEKVVAATDAAGPVEPPARPVVLTAESARPPKALASAAATSSRSAECWTTAGNADPTNGEISGARGLPDQVAYFKSRGHGTPCPPIARAVSESP